MESLTRSLNYELSSASAAATSSPSAISSLTNNNPLNKHAQQILENSKNIFSTAAVAAASADASTPTITTLDAKSSKSILQTISDTILNSIQTKNNYHKSVENVSNSNSKYFNLTNMEYTPNHVVLDSSSFDAIDELQRQLEYDKFMNEVWIGIVLTLILISMVFCICSCFLYHQFKTWKQNYHTTPHELTHDIEAVKMPTERDDPVPEYTLVSGLPTYEAALELMQKTPKACLIVYPSVFSVFNKNEKTTTTPTSTTLLEIRNDVSLVRSTSATFANTEVTTPLLTTSTTTTAMKTTTTPIQENLKTFWNMPSYSESLNFKEKSKTQQTNKSASPITATTTSNETQTANTTTTTNHSHGKSSEQTLANKNEKC